MLSKIKQKNKMSYLFFMEKMTLFYQALAEKLKPSPFFKISKNNLNLVSKKGCTILTKNYMSIQKNLKIFQKNKNIMVHHLVDFFIFQNCFLSQKMLSSIYEHRVNR